MLLIAPLVSKTALRQPANQASECNPAERPVYLTIREIFLASDSNGLGQAQTHPLQ